MELRTQIEKLNRIGIALSREHNLRALLELIVTESRNFTQADAGSLYLREDNRLIFEVAQNGTLERRLGSAREAFRPFPLPLTERSIAGYVALTGKPLSLPDVYHLPPDTPFSHNPEFDRRNNYRTQSMLVLPMPDHEGEIIGVLQLINAQDPSGRVIPFAPEYEDLVASLSSQAAVAIRNAQLIAEIKRLFEAFVEFSASAIDARSPHTAGHSARVARLALRIAEAINQEREGPFAEIRFSPGDLEELRMAAWMHDIGKIGVRERVLEKAKKLSEDRMEAIRQRFQYIKKATEMELLKKGFPPEEALRKMDEDLEFLERINAANTLSLPDLARLQAIAAQTYQDLLGRSHPYLTEGEMENLSVRRGNLTREEYQEVQNHIQHTIEILSKVPFTKNLKNVPFYAATHHEMLDGSGYPRGLTAKDLPLQSRILALLDIYDALVAADRPYKPALPVEEALEILRDHTRRGRLDPNVVELFIRRRLYETGVPPEMEEPPFF